MKLFGKQQTEYCPLCKSTLLPVIYYGLSMKLCSNEQCSLLTGFWSFIARWLPFTGNFTVYEKGHFWSGLWFWWKNV